MHIYIGWVGEEGQERHRGHHGQLPCVHQQQGIFHVIEPQKLVNLILEILHAFLAKLQDFPTIYFTTLFYVQGRKVWSVKLPHSVLCIEKMDIPSRGLFLVAVALASNHVLVYNDKNVVDCFKMDDTVSAMKFGRFGREENTLVLGKLCDRQ